ncbi:unnamed protein product [Sphagnum tenellum]
MIRRRLQSTQEREIADLSAIVPMERKAMMRAVGVGASVLPATQRRHEVALGSIGLGDDGGEAAIGKQGVGRPTHTNWITGRGIRKRPPLRCP